MFFFSKCHNYTLTQDNILPCIERELVDLRKKIEQGSQGSYWSVIAAAQFRIRWLKNNPFKIAEQKINQLRLNFNKLISDCHSLLSQQDFSAEEKKLHNLENWIKNGNYEEGIKAAQARFDWVKEHPLSLSQQQQLSLLVSYNKIKMNCINLLSKEKFKNHEQIRNKIEQNYQEEALKKTYNRLIDELEGLENELKRGNYKLIECAQGRLNALRNNQFKFPKDQNDFLLLGFNNLIAKAYCQWAKELVNVHRRPDLGLEMLRYGLSYYQYYKDHTDEDNDYMEIEDETELYDYLGCCAYIISDAEILDMKETKKEAIDFFEQSFGESWSEYQKTLDCCSL